MNIIAIARNPINSPGMEDSDRAILHAVAQQLELLGDNVNIIDENETIESKNCDAIYHMSRNNFTLLKLQEVEEKGCNVINKAQGVRNCSRKECVELMRINNIPQPPFSIISTEDYAPTNGYPLWFKKADGWSCCPQDVCFATSQEEGTNILSTFHERGINEVICTQHIDGDLIKFYGVKETFFHWYYPAPENGKFGLEKINGRAKQHSFNCEQLKETANEAARAIGIDIYGGDAIVTPNGDFYIIDLNDFPSFSSCREEAAKAISKLIHNKL